MGGFLQDLGIWTLFSLCVTTNFSTAHISIVCFHNEGVDRPVQVAEDLGHDHADDDQEEHHAVARHPLKSPQHHQVGLDDATASCNRDSEMTWPKITTNKKKTFKQSTSST